MIQTILAGLLLGTAGTSMSCGLDPSNTDLNPEGPPMVRQVFVTERVTIGDADRILEGQIAFGSHADAFFDDDDGQVAAAIALGTQDIRVVIDELLLGNAFEEVGCADGTFSQIPVGTTPDDMADCTGGLDVIAQTCTKVCLADDGTPIGVRDEVGFGGSPVPDGSPDDFRMITYPDGNLGVILSCDGTNVPLDPEESFWNPSGNQIFPSNDTLGFRGLGPSVVLRPVADTGLRTGSNCTISFQPQVTDHDGNQVCAPEGGNIENDCAPGDTSRIAFSTEPLAVLISSPKDGDTNVGTSSNAFMLLQMTGNLDVNTVGAITLTADGVDVPITPTVAEDDPTSVSIFLETPFEADTTYVMTVGTGLADRLGGTFPATETITWTTAAAAPTPDAAPEPDAAP